MTCPHGCVTTLGRCLCFEGGCHKFANEAGKWWHTKSCPTGKSLRDSWCTDAEVARALGRFTLDPCSNPRSLIRADATCSLEAGTCGLTTSWADHDVYFNGPFSKLLPWTAKVREARSVVAMVNSDHSTAWWRAFVANGCTLEFKFHKRRAFSPPPHIKSSTNSKPQSLLCTPNAASRLQGTSLDTLGHWWGRA